MNPQKPLANEQPKFIEKMLAQAQERKARNQKDDKPSGKEKPEVFITKGYRDHLRNLKNPEESKRPPL